MATLVTTFLATAIFVGPGVAGGWLASHPRPVDEPADAITSLGPQWRAQQLDLPDTAPVWVADPVGDRPLIVMVHGFRQPRTDLRELANHLHDRGYGIALVELPYLDGSEAYSGGQREAEAITKYVTALRGAERPVVLMGFSAGGFASALAVSRGLQVDALITDSAFLDAGSTFRRVAETTSHLPSAFFDAMNPAFEIFSGGGDLSTVEPPKGFTPPPTFVIHCETDDYVLPKNAYALQATFNGKIWIALGQGHGGAWYADHTGYESRVNTFLSNS